eukprot:396035_1
MFMDMKSTSLIVVTCSLLTTMTVFGEWTCETKNGAQTTNEWCNSSCLSDGLPNCCKEKRRQCMQLCECTTSGNITVDVELETDYWPCETSFVLVDENEYVWDNVNFTDYYDNPCVDVQKDPMVYNFTYNLPACKEYNLTVSDSWGDGWTSVGTCYNESQYYPLLHVGYIEIKIDDNPIYEREYCLDFDDKTYTISGSDPAFCKTQTYSEVCGNQNGKKNGRKNGRKKGKKKSNTA